MTDRNRTLIVDDDEATLSGLGGLLELEGYAVEKARNGREALDRIGAAPEAFGLILLDLKMPVMDGWQFLAERAKVESILSVPVVLLSGLPYIPNAAGVADFLSKPVNPARLMECVRRFCGEPAKARSGLRAES